MPRLAWLLKIGLLSSLATVFMFYQVPLFPSAPYLKYDLSEVPALVGAFALGPVAGVAIILLKNALFCLARFQPQELVGIPTNTLAGLILVLTCSHLYRLKKTRRVAVAALAAGVLAMTLSMVPASLLLLPYFYRVFLGLELSPTLLQASLVTVTLFNLVKGTLTSTVTFLVYKRFSRVLKSEPLWEVEVPGPARATGRVR